MLGEPILQIFFDLEWKAVLEKTRDFLSVVSVAVTDREKVAVTQIKHMRIRQVSILVYFVGVVSCYSALGCKRKFSDHIMHTRWVSRSTACFLLAGW